MANGTKLTAAQAVRLADAFGAVADEIRLYRNRNRDELDQEALETLKWDRLDLLGASRRLRNSAVRLGLEEVSRSVGEIVAATRELEEFVRTVETVKDVMGHVATAVRIAVAVTSGNVAGLTTAVGETGRKVR